MNEPITKATFSPFLGQTFILQLDEQALEVQLTEADAVDKGGLPGGREPFALVFRGPTDTPLGQGTYPVRHDALGEMAIFLVPIGPDAEGLCYEAVFS